MYHEKNGQDCGTEKIGPNIEKIGLKANRRRKLLLNSLFGLLCALIDKLYVEYLFDQIQPNIIITGKHKFKCNGFLKFKHKHIILGIYKYKYVFRHTNMYLNPSLFCHDVNLVFIITCVLLSDTPVGFV